MRYETIPVYSESYPAEDSCSQEALTALKTKIILQWLQIAAGLFVFSFGEHLTIFANIGLAPWDCLGMGIAIHTPLNYGLAMTLTSVLVVCIDLILHERIGYGTIIDALLTGNFVQFFNDRNPFPENTNLFSGILCMMIGFIFMALGIMIYIRAGQGCGPRDALLVGVGKRMPRLPIGIVEILLWTIVLLAGWLLGGPVGIGTLLSTFGAGFVMQAVYTVFHFEPRDIHQRDLLHVTRILLHAPGD